jgi:hypothetical protein
MAAPAPMTSAVITTIEANSLKETENPMKPFL